MKLLPPPAVNFTVVEPEPVPRLQLLKVMFWYHRDHHESQRHLLGAFIGNPILDPVFAKKLNRLRLKLTISGIPWHDSIVNIHEEELRENRRLDMQQKRQRKISRCHNVYAEEMKKIENSSLLFKDEAIRELNQKLDLTLKKIDEIYGDGYSRGTYMAQKAD